MSNHEYKIIYKYVALLKLPFCSQFKKNHKKKYFKKCAYIYMLMKESVLSVIEQTTQHWFYDSQMENII